MAVSSKDIRRLFLDRQGLLRRNQFGRGKQAVLKAIKRKSYLQIDTISVVRRAHEHILLSRVDNFDAKMLHSLHDNRLIYEYWGHAAAYLPFEHFRYSLPVMQGFAASRPHDKKLAKEILARITAEGAMQSRHFEDSREGKNNGWWDWKPAKQVLEYLFLSGELMVTRREGFQKVFDLPERVIPEGTDTRMPSQEEWCRHIALTMVAALGAGTRYDLAYALPTIRRLSRLDLKQQLKATLDELTEDGALVTFNHQGAAYYSTDELLGSLPYRLGRKEVRLLSPFDNLVINRRRLLALFGFDYQLECYLPESRRRYGYFSLPLLWGDELIGRLDAKAERKQRLLTINNLALEEGTRPTADLAAALALGIASFASANDCDQAQVMLSDPKPLRTQLNKALSGFE